MHRWGRRRSLTAELGKRCFAGARLAGGPLEARDRALCEFAAKLTHRQHEMAPADLDALRAHGFDDRASHDAVQVIGYFNYIARVADALGVEPENFIRDWGT